MKTSRFVYFSYFYFICLYVIIIRLQAVPIGLSYVLYGLSIASCSFALLSKGMSKWNKKQDLFFIVFFFSYYFLSGVIYIAGVSDFLWIFKDFLYALLPIFFYILLRASRQDLDDQIILKITWISILIIDVISIMMLFNIGFNISSFFRQETLEYEGTLFFALSGVVGVMFTGVINVIGIIICTFSSIRINKILKVASITFFVLCVFLTGQRTPIGGVAIVALVFVLQKKLKGLTVVAVAISIIILAFPVLDIEIEGVSVNEALFERTLSRFDNVAAGETGRNDQYKLYNTENIFEFVFGEGVGAHSPENPNCATPMPDAMLFRIFNEMGIIGLSAFLLFYFINMIKAIKKKNWFMISLIAYMFLANATNRVLFFAPLSIMPYFLLAYFNWHDVKQNNIVIENAH